MDFELTLEHVKLISKLNFRAEEEPHTNVIIPQIDNKRVFGNYGNVFEVLNILGERTSLETYMFSKEQITQAMKLLIELPCALKIVHKNMTFQLGTYKFEIYDSTYREYMNNIAELDEKADVFYNQMIIANG